MRKQRSIWKGMILGILLTGVLFAVIFTGAQRIKASELGRQEIYLSIRIEKGDSIWSIAKQYHESEELSLNAYMEKLILLNGLKKDASLHAGEYLLIPTSQPLT